MSPPDRWTNFSFPISPISPKTSAALLESVNNYSEMPIPQAKKEYEAQIQRIIHSSGDVVLRIEFNYKSEVTKHPIFHTTS